LDEIEREFVGGLTWDDVRGGDLPERLVKVAREEEVTFMQKRELWKVVPVEESWEKTGKAPVPLSTIPSSA
jgi:hypothetical protein